MKWKVEYTSSDVEYLDPNKVTIRMYNCDLRNNRKSAMEIHSGANKKVCSWVLCESIEINEIGNKYLPDEEEIRYNPRILPYWTHKGANVDGGKFNLIESYGNKLYRNLKE